MSSIFQGERTSRILGANPRCRFPCPGSRRPRGGADDPEQTVDMGGAPTPSPATAGEGGGEGGCHCCCRRQCHMPSGNPNFALLSDAVPHSVRYDASRDAFLGKRGFVVMRFRDNAVSTQTVAVLEQIRTTLLSRRPSPPPSPAVAGEGGAVTLRDRSWAASPIQGANFDDENWPLQTMGVARSRSLPCKAFHYFAKTISTVTCDSTRKRSSMAR